MMSKTVVVADPQGVHALLASRLCEIAGTFSASAWIVADGKRSSLIRPFELMALEVHSGAQVAVMTDGIDEVEALEALCSLLETG